MQYQLLNKSNCKNENIDIINFTNNDSLLISRALTPATTTRIELDEENRRAAVYLEADQVSLAIGKGGINIKLASSLANYEIDVFRNSDTTEFDIDLDEFKDEIEVWMIDELKKIEIQEKAERGVAELIFVILLMILGSIVLVFALILAAYGLNVWLGEPYGYVVILVLLLLTLGIVYNKKSEIKEIITETIQKEMDAMDS